MGQRVSTPGHPEKKHIVVVGAGPGGLTTAMLLANRGFKVTVFEKDDRIGGRNAAIQRNGYTFDTGPTFLMMKFILDEVFEEAGRRSEDCLKFLKLEPMYRLQFDDVRLEPTTNREAMLRQLDAAFPGNREGYARFLAGEKQRFEVMYPCLQKDYSSLRQYLSRDLLRALPRLSIGRSLLDVLGGYFEPDKLKLSFTFQSKYLGMSAWECPGAFAILPYVEHASSGWHTAVVWMRLMVDFRRRMMEAARARGEPVAAMGPALGFRELKWMKPVFVDDTIDYTSEIIAARNPRSRACRGRPSAGSRKLLPPE